MPALELAYDVGITYEAGSDTTTMAMEVFVMATVLYGARFVPKARKEIDYVVGQNGMPAFSDIPALPYLQAIVNEVLRWRPVGAGEILHAVTKDDEYVGYRVPAGATIIGDRWVIRLDENVYEDPYSFNPNWWIENPNLPLKAFGFGSRVCTGQHIVKNSFLINITRMLWAFDIGHKYEYGIRQDINPLAMTQGFNSRPMPIKAAFQLRSTEIRAVVDREWQMAVEDIGCCARECSLIHGQEDLSVSRGIYSAWQRQSRAIE
jgi:cytochrome P450